MYADIHTKLSIHTGSYLKISFSLTALIAPHKTPDETAIILDG